MEIIFLPDADEDLSFWKKSGDKEIQKKISEILHSIIENPKTGIGKPEQLKHNLTGLWSRRINSKHRIIYEIIDNKIIVHSLRGHYE
jgi:toxin YoeB